MTEPDPTSHSRRDFLRGALAMTAGLAAGGPASAADEPPPDVLFIAIEDLTPRFGCYGDPVVKTPNLDRLAERAVVFTNAHCQAAVCNPSRAAISTGLRPGTTGVYGNELDWRERIPQGHACLYEHFRDHGYETVTIGKIHHAENLFAKAFPGGQEREDRMWNRRLTRGPGKKIAPPRTPAAPRPENLPEDHYIVRSLNWGPTGVADHEQQDGAIARAVAEELRQPGDRPRFLAVGLHTPHYPLRAPDAYFALYPPESIELPQTPPGDLDDLPGTYGVFNTSDDRWLSPREKQEVIAAYYACISYVDACVGVMLDALRDSGREGNTIVCLWGDHGMHLGEHGLFRKATLFEGATRVPFILAAPAVTPGGVRCSRPTELIDMYPTLADLCGLPPPKGIEAVSMRPLLEDPTRPWKACAFTSRGPGAVTLRTDRYRYTEWRGPDRAELYDHDTDPGEFTNLAGAPEHAATRERLAALMRAGWRGALPDGVAPA